MMIINYKAQGPMIYDKPKGWYILYNKINVIISLCHDVIIANSSFSWWSAYFNNYHIKVILYPSSYYYNNNDNENDRGNDDDNTTES